MKRMNDRGEAALELAIVAPVLMLLLLGVLQFGLWYHAQNVVQTAALEASRVAVAEEAASNDGEDRARTVLIAGLGSAVSEPVVLVDLGQDDVRVSVQASMRGLLPLPGLSEIRLSAESVSYRERFRSATQ